MDESVLQRLPQDAISTLRSSVNIVSLAQAATELVHNALDAQATNVDVFIDTSLLLCRIVDNGLGIRPDDFGSLATRYCTTKYNMQSNLYGYRGEALASLADIGLLEITSRHDSSDETYSLIIHGGSKVYQGPAKHAKLSAGTTVTVRDLFFKLPVRQKLVPKRLSVLNSIRRTLEIIALANPSISFHLTDLERDTKILYLRSKGDDVLARWATIYGSDTVENVDTVDCQILDYRIEGFISRNTSPNTKHQYIYVERLPILPCSIHRSVNEVAQRSTFGRWTDTRDLTHKPNNPSLLSHPVYSESGERRGECSNYLVYWFNFRPLDRRRADWLPEAGKGVLGDHDIELITKALVKLIEQWLRERGYVCKKPVFENAPHNSEREDNNSHNAFYYAFHQNREELERVKRPRMDQPTQKPKLPQHREYPEFPTPAGIDRSNLVKFSGSMNESTVPDWIGQALRDYRSPNYRTGQKAIRSLNVLPIPKGSSHFGTENNMHNTFEGMCGLDQMCKLMTDGMGASMEGSVTRQQLSDAEYIAQVDEKWLILSCKGTSNNDERMLVVVDQHAADERVRLEEFLYDSYEQIHRNGRVEVENLKEPVVIVLSNSEFQSLALEDTMSIMNSWGLSITISSGISNAVERHQIEVTQVPLVIAERLKSEPNLIRNIIVRYLAKVEDEVNSNHNRRTTRSRILQTCPDGIMELIVSRACRGAIMFNDELTNDEAKRLLERLQETRYPFECAHGRPSMVPITRYHKAQTKWRRVNWGHI